MDNARDWSSDTATRELANAASDAYQAWYRYGRNDTVLPVFTAMERLAEALGAYMALRGEVYRRRAREVVGPVEKQEAER